MLIIIMMIIGVLVTMSIYTIIYHMLYYDFYCWYVKKYPWRLLSIRYIYKMIQSLLQLTVKVRRIGSIFETKESFHDKIENKKMQIYKNRFFMIVTLYVCCIAVFYVLFNIKDWTQYLWIVIQGITKENIIDTIEIIAKWIQQYTPIVTTVTFIIIVIFTYNYNKARYKLKNTIYAEENMKSLYKKIVKIRGLIVRIIIKIEDNLGQFYLTKEYTEQSSDLISIVVREYIKEKYDHGKENNYETILLNAFQEIEEMKMLEETVRGIKEYQQDILRHLELEYYQVILPDNILLIL